MAAFVIRRLSSMALVLFTVSVLVFAVFNVIPNGDPAVRMAGQAPSDFEIQAIRQEWGFDEPVWVQYATMMRKLATGDVVSYFTQANVVDEIVRGAPHTFSLAIGAALIWFAVGVVLGLVSAVRAGRASDRLITVLAVIGVSVPGFWVGALANHYLGFRLGIFPNGGYVPLTENPLRWAYHLVLPWLTLALLLTGVYSRVLRTHLLDTLSASHVQAARAKGITGRQVLLRHVLRNSLIPVVTLWGLDFGVVVGGGAILIEAVFDLEGVGQYAAGAIGDLDVPPVLAVTLFGAFFIVVVNALVDIAYAWLDPRVRAR